jgi:hypothetical protein
MDTEKLVKVFIKIRDTKDALVREHEKQVGELDAKLDVIRGALLKIANETGTESLKTKSGTVIRSIKTRYWAANWDEFKNFLVDLGPDGYDLVERRVHQGNMKQFLEENPDTKPPVNVNSEYTITVRRSNK